MHKSNAEKNETRKFGIGLTVVLCIFGGWQLYKGNVDIYKWFFGFAILILFLSFFVPTFIKPLYKILTTISGAIGWFNTRIILGIVFYIIITPIGLFLRLIRKDLLDRRWDKNAKSYWIKKEKGEFDRKHYERQF